MRKAHFELAMERMFDINTVDSLQADYPLSAEQFLGSSDFKLAFSIVFGDDDYMEAIDHGEGEKLVKSKNRDDCKYYVVPKSGHDLFVGNPNNVSTILINDLLNLKVADEDDKEYFATE